MPLSENVKEEIQAVYSGWLTNNNYKPRRPQREMIARVANFLGDIDLDEDGLRKDDFEQQLCIVQAGTGTGKTVAYVIAALVLAKHLNKKVVVATATIALQEQLLNKDLPDLLSSSPLDFSFAIAKGRSRYLCLSRLNLRLNEAGGDATGLFPDEDQPLARSVMLQLDDLSKDFVKQAWDGEYDSLPETFDVENWPLIAAERTSCTGKKCSNYSNCVLFQARDDVRKADLIVANHDLTLADLTVGGGAVLPPAEEIIYVIDEAHHFPEKSRNHFSASMSIAAERNHLQQTHKLFKRIQALSALPFDFSSVQADILRVDEALEASLQAINVMLKDLFGRIDDDLKLRAQFDTDTDGSCRFKHGALPPQLEEAFSDLESCYALKLKKILSLQETLAEQLVDTIELPASEQLQIEQSLASLGQIAAQLQSASALAQIYADTTHDDSNPHARWLRQRDSYLSTTESAGDDIQIFGAPLSTAEILNTILWSRCFASVLTSATLSPDGSFNHFIEKLGHGSPALSYLIHGQLNFSEAVFHVPRMSSLPNNATLHTEEIIQLIPKLCAADTGTLVLFSSRRQMEDVAEMLAVELEPLVQGQGSKRRLIEQHKARIDEGERSVLFGLASFAEGLDLPGAHCEQVIIAKLPFAVPDSPVDQAIGEWVESRGGNGFTDISLPEAAIRLMQACGRLLRNETDSGRVSLLDRRIVEKYYGKQLLRSLPPFQIQID